MAGVSIQTLTGENGILRKAENAKNRSEISEEKEEIQLGYNEYKIKEYTDTNPELKIKGAIVYGNMMEGWNIEFNNTKHSYKLSSNGTIEINNKKISILEKSEDTYLGGKTVYEVSDAEYESIKIKNGKLEIKLLNNQENPIINLDINKYQDTVDCVNIRNFIWD